MASLPVNPKRSDPIRERFFEPLSIADKISNWLFFITALLSFSALLFDAKTAPRCYNFVQVAFIVSAVVLFILGQTMKLYFWPRAEEPRRRDFLSNGLVTELTHLRTNGYYNNNETDPWRRIGALILENTLFTKTIVLRMLIKVRILTFVYMLAWLTALAIRTTDLGWIAVAAQVIFSEQLVSRWLRMEWLRSKTEKIHNNLLTVFISGATPDAMKSIALDAFTDYESAKANAGVLTSDKIFNKINPSLSAEWEQIKRTANIL